MKYRSNEYFLMHKDIPVCLCEIDNDGNLSHVRRNEETKQHFPLGGQMNDIKFHEWWTDRAIPKTRHGVKTALQKLGYPSTGSALVNNLALSLTDCYWIKPRGENIAWKDINLFTNDFIDTFGELTFNPDEVIDLRNQTKFNFATSQGELQKKWCIAKDGRRYMIKGNYGLSYQQSLNEIFATRIHQAQGFKDYTRYYPVKIMTEGNQEGLGCLSYDFCNENVECISAWDLLQTMKIRQNQSLFYPLKEKCLSMGMTETYFQHFIDYEIMTDYLITNIDRHMNNIAIMRDPDSLKLIGFAPIYDSGNSMFYNVPLNQLSSIHLQDITTHSFIRREVDLLKYVSNRGAVNLNKIYNDFSLYEQDIPERHNRIPILKTIFNKKIKSLQVFQDGQDIWKRY